VLFLNVEIDHGAVWNNHVAPVFVTAGRGITPLAGHHPLKKVSAVIKLAAEQIDKIVNATPTLCHQLGKFLESYLVHGELTKLGNLGNMGFEENSGMTH
jgi:hypothetical protein